MHTSVAGHASNYGSPGAEAGAHFFARLARMVRASGPAPDELADPFIEEQARAVQEIRFGRRSCIVVKRMKPWKR